MAQGPVPKQRLLPVQVTVCVSVGLRVSDLEKTMCKHHVTAVFLQVRDGFQAGS